MWGLQGRTAHRGLSLQRRLETAIDDREGTHFAKPGIQKRRRLYTLLANPGFHKRRHSYAIREARRPKATAVTQCTNPGVRKRRQSRFSANPGIETATTVTQFANLWHFTNPDVRKQRQLLTQSEERKFVVHRRKVLLIGVLLIGEAVALTESMY